MKISAEVRELWTQYLQGQLPAPEQEALAMRLKTEPELAKTLAADADMHQLLLDHFATQPALKAVLSSLPERSFGQRSDSSFVARCVAAVGASILPGPAENDGIPSRLGANPSASDGAAPTTPPVFLAGLPSTYAPSDSMPPIAVEPPPFCESELPAASRSGKERHGRRVAWMLALTVGLVAAGVWSLWGGAWTDGDGAAFAAKEPRGTGSPPANQAANQAADQAEPRSPDAENSAAGKSAVAAADTLTKAPPLTEGLAEANVPPQPGGLANSPLMEKESPRAEANRFPQVIRGGDAEEPNFIKDPGEEIPSGPQRTPLPAGQLLASRDAEWQADPSAWGLPPDGGDRPGNGKLREIRLNRGVAQVVLESGLRIGLQAPAVIERVSPTKWHLIEGQFLVESTTNDAPLEWAISTDSFELEPVTTARFFVTTFPEFGTGVEILEGEGRLTPQSGLGEPESIRKAGHFAGHFLPVQDASGTRPGAAALAHSDGTLSGRIVAFDTPLLISSPEVFGATLQTLVSRMREAPADLARDWKHVLERLEQLKAADRRRPGLQHEVRFAGDLLPAFPELQAELGRGIPTPKGPFDIENIRQFAGQLNLNGRLIGMNDLGELKNIQQELAAELAQLRAQQEQMRGNRNRRNALEPDFMAQQLLIQQMQQIEMILRLAQGLQLNGGNIPGGAMPQGPREPLVVSFTSLVTPEGQQDRAVVMDKLQRDLEEALEDEAAREQRLQRLREKLHQ